MNGEVLGAARRPWPSALPSLSPLQLHTPSCCVPWVGAAFYHSQPPPPPLPSLLPPPLPSLLPPPPLPPRMLRTLRSLFLPSLAACGWINQPLPHLHRDRAHPATSALGLGSPLPHLHRDWAHPCAHLHRDRACCVALQSAAASSELRGVEDRCVAPARTRSPAHALARTLPHARTRTHAHTHTHTHAHTHRYYGYT